MAIVIPQTGYSFSGAPVVTRADLEGVLSGMDTAAPLTPLALGAVGDGVKRRLRDVGSVSQNGVQVTTTGFSLGQWQSLLSAATSLDDYLDRVALQTALTLAAGKRAVLVPVGVLVVQDKTLTVAGRTVLVIDGTLVLDDGVNSHNILLNVGANNVSITGAGVIDGNRAHQTASNGPGFPNSGGNGGIKTWLLAYPAISNDNIRVSGLTFRNILQWPVSFDGCTDVVVSGCTMKDSGNAPQFAFGSSKCVAANNVMSDIPDYAFATYEGCSFCVIEGNISDRCGPFGVLNDGDATIGWQNIPQHDIIISGNVSNDSLASGVTVATVVSNGAAEFPYNVLVKGNTIRNSTGTAIVLAGVRDSTIEGNYVSTGRAQPGGNTWSGVSGIGVNLVISSNVFTNYFSDPRGDGVARSGIDVSNFSNTVFSSNYFCDNTGNTPNYAFGGTVGNEVTFCANIFGSLPSPPFSPATIVRSDTRFVGHRDGFYQISDNVIVRSLEIGPQTGGAHVGQTFVDFHTGPIDAPGAADFDARILAAGGTGTAGQGSLSLYAALVAMNAPLVAITGQLNIGGVSPTDPHVAGRVWSNAGVLMISAG